METTVAIRILTALADDGRMEVFRLSAPRAPDMVAAGDIARAQELKPDTLSVHAAALKSADRLRMRREGRSIRCAIAPQTLGGAIDFLAADCCRGRPDSCAPP